MSEKIKAHHLNRNAVLYVRQSSTFQVTHNEESCRLQYAMEQRIRNLGWQEVSVIDEDLGRSASGNVERMGFQRMVAEVCLGQVGVVAAREVSRFARNSKDWQQLIEVSLGQKSRASILAAMQAKPSSFPSLADSLTAPASETPH
jgi:DNA invertase Pin-like site-specific DNA recombinase